MRHGDAVNSASFSPDGTRIVTASDDKTARLWDAHTGRPIGQPMRHDDKVKTAFFSPDGTRVITASWDRTARLWDGHTGKPIGKPLRNIEPVGLAAWNAEGAINSANFSADGTRLLTVAYGSVRVWDARTEQPIGVPMRHEDVVGSASFSADGNRVVTDSGDNTAYLWDAQTMQPMGEPMRHEQRVGSVSFSPDGTRIITASDDASARLWDGTSGQPIGEKLEHASSVISAAFSPDGTHVVTTSTDNTARLWDIFPPNAEVPPMWLADLAEAVGAEALSDLGSFEPVDADRFFKIKAGLAGSAGSDFWSIAGRWFFADRETRTISPLSTITIGEYLARSPPYLGLGVSNTPRNSGRAGRIECRQCCRAISRHESGAAGRRHGHRLQWQTTRQDKRAGICRHGCRQRRRKRGACRNSEARRQKVDRCHDRSQTLDIVQIKLCPCSPRIRLRASSVTFRCGTAFKPRTLWSTCENCQNSLLKAGCRRSHIDSRRLLPEKERWPIAR